MLSLCLTTLYTASRRELYGSEKDCESTSRSGTNSVYDIYFGLSTLFTAVCTKLTILCWFASKVYSSKKHPPIYGGKSWTWVWQSDFVPL